MWNERTKADCIVSTYICARTECWPNVFNSRSKPNEYKTEDKHDHHRLADVNKKDVPSHLRKPTSSGTCKLES